MFDVQGRVFTSSHWSMRLVHLSRTQLIVGKENVQQIQFTKVSWLPQWRMKDQVKSHHLSSGIADKYFHNKDLSINRLYNCSHDNHMTTRAVIKPHEICSHKSVWLSPSSPIAVTICHAYTLWLHQLLALVVDKYIIICPKFPV